MKKAVATILVVLFAFMPCFAAAIVPQTTLFYVNDSANVLSDDTEEYIINHSADLDEKTKAQIVVVTVQNLDGMSIEEYATRLFREYGIGDAKLNNGVLMLLAINERLSRIEVGYGLEGILNDAKTGRIQDEYMIPYYKKNDFDGGALNGYKAIFSEVAREYDYDTNVQPERVYSSSDATRTSARIGLGLIEIYLIICFFTYSISSIATKSLKSAIIVFCINEIIGIILVCIKSGLSDITSELGTITLMNFLALVMGYLTRLGVSGYRYGGYRGGSHHSSGGFHGGGGRSGGGGSTRGF